MPGQLGTSGSYRLAIQPDLNPKVWVLGRDDVKTRRLDGWWRPIEVCAADQGLGCLCERRKNKENETNASLKTCQAISTSLLDLTAVVFADGLLLVLRTRVRVEQHNLGHWDDRPSSHNAPATSNKLFTIDRSLCVLSLGIAV